MNSQNMPEDITAQIAHHMKMAAFHANEATQLLKRTGAVSTAPARKGKYKLSDEEKAEIQDAVRTGRRINRKNIKQHLSK